MTDDRRDDLLERALAAYRTTDNELAESLVKELLVLDENDAEAHMLLGSLYGREGHFSLAINQFYKVLEGSSDHPEAWNNIGAMHRSLGQLDQSLEALEKARSIDPENAGVHYNLGNVYKQLDRKTEAASAYEISLKLNHRNLAAYNNLGNIYEAQGDLDKAHDTYRRGLEIDTNHPTLRYNLGLVYQKKNDFKQARQAFEAALKGKPGWKPGLNNLGITLQKLGNKEEARALFQEMVANNPENPEAFNNLGMLHVEAGRFQEAETQFVQAIKINPRYARAVLNLDVLFHKDGRLEDSHELLSRFSLLEPGNLTVRLQLAKVRLLLNKTEKAEEDLLAVLNKEPGNVDALRTLGNLYLKTKRSPLAQKVAKRIERVDPSNVELHMDMALFAMGEGDNRVAEDEVKLYLMARPADTNARLLLANLTNQQGRIDDAREILETLRLEDGKNTGVLGALARIYQQTGDQKGALQLADEILRVQGHTSAEDELSLMVETLELYEKSAQSIGEDMKETWSRNLRALADTLPAAEEEPGAIEDQTPLVEEPSWMQLQDEPSKTSLLSLGDLNPAIIIDEEEHSMILQEEEEILYRPESEEPPRPGSTNENPQGPPPIVIQFHNAPFSPVTETPGNESGQKQNTEPQTISDSQAPPPQRAMRVFEPLPEREPDPTPWVPVPRRDTEEPVELEEQLPLHPQEGLIARSNDYSSPPQQLVSAKEGVEQAKARMASEANQPLVRRPEKVAELINFLDSLSGFLPEEKLDLLQSDEIHLKLDQIRRSLSSGDTIDLPENLPLPENGEDADTAQ